MNAIGEVVGLSATLGETELHAVLWTPSDGMIDLGTLGGTFTVGTAVNDSGQVVGYGTLAGDVDTHAFSWTKSGGMIDLGTLGGSWGIGQAVSPSGQVVGFSYTKRDEETHAFSWVLNHGKDRHNQRSRMMDLRTLGGTFSAAYAVNDRGQVVGSSSTRGDTETHAVLWQARPSKDDKARP